MKTLLLDSTYKIIAFIDYTRAVKLMVRDRVDVLSVWEGQKICYGNGFINHPAILKLKYVVRRYATKLSFSRKLVLRRDNYSCVYCGSSLDHKKLTIDHIIPKSLGGTNSFTNCVAACFPCNSKKANKTLQEAKMNLLYQPFVPTTFLCYYPKDMEWHNDWNFFKIT